MEERTRLIWSIVMTVAVLAMVGTGFYFYFSHESMVKKITVDYSMTVRSFIALGDYEAPIMNPADYPADAEKSGVKELKAKFFYPVLPTSFFTKDELIRMENKHYRPASLIELMEYVLEHPDPQVSIVAMGSTRKDGADYTRSPYLQAFIDGNKLRYRLAEVCISNSMVSVDAPFVILGVKE